MQELYFYLFGPLISYVHYPPLNEVLEAYYLSPSSNLSESHLCAVRVQSISQHDRKSLLGFRGECVASLQLR